MSAVAFTTPPLGLEPLVDFELNPVEGATGLFSLQSCQDADVRLFLLDPGIYFPGYNPRIDEADLERLGSTGGDLQVLVIANPGADGTTANLLAPVLVNGVTGNSSQVVLEGSAWPIRAALGERRG